MSVAASPPRQPAADADAEAEAEAEATTRAASSMGCSRFPGRGSLGRREQSAHEPLMRRATPAQVPLNGLSFSQEKKVKWGTFQSHVRPIREKVHNLLLRGMFSGNAQLIGFCDALYDRRGHLWTFTREPGMNRNAYQYLIDAMTAHFAGTPSPSLLPTIARPNAIAA